MQKIGLTLVVIFIGLVVLHPIEHKRIEGYCESITVGSNIESALFVAKKMFGVEVWEKPESNTYVILSNFTFKTICFIKTEDNEVISANFNND